MVSCTEFLFYSLYCKSIYNLTLILITYSISPMNNLHPTSNSLTGLRLCKGIFRSLSSGTQKIWVFFERANTISFPHCRSCPSVEFTAKLLHQHSKFFQIRHSRKFQYSHVSFLYHNHSECCLFITSFFKHSHSLLLLESNASWLEYFQVVLLFSIWHRGFVGVIWFFPTFIGKTLFYYMHLNSTANRSPSTGFFEFLPPVRRSLRSLPDALPGVHVHFLLPLIPALCATQEAQYLPLPATTDTASKRK